MNIFLDDERSPQDVTWIVLPITNWTVVRNFAGFKRTITELWHLGNQMPNIISFDHDLHEDHYQRGAKHNYLWFDYENLAEPTGYCCAVWLCEFMLQCKVPPDQKPKILTHTLNPRGALNITKLMGAYGRRMVEQHVPLARISKRIMGFNKPKQANA